MLRIALFLASIANCAGGIVLIATWALLWQEVPPIVVFIGGSRMVTTTAECALSHSGRPGRLHKM